MKTLREVAQIIEPSSNPSVNNLTKDVGLNSPVSVRQLIEIISTNFIDHNILRMNIEIATINFKAEFGSEDCFERRCYGENLNESQVNSFFTNKPPWEVDCLGAARIIMAKGLIDSLKSGEFDNLGYTTSEMNMIFRPVAKADQMEYGEWSYFKNDENYRKKHKGGGYQGENVIKVGNDKYFGFPKGVKSEAEWIQELIDAYNYGLDPSEYIYKVPGFLGEKNCFFNTVKISKDIIKLRRGFYP